MLGSPTMSADVGEKAAAVHDCRVILYKEPFIVLVACPLGTSLARVS